MNLNNGERQVAPTLDGIRRDHVARYEWVSKRVKNCKVADLACGIGYGSKILADAGNEVLAVDASSDAIQYAQTHFSHDWIDYVKADLSKSDIAFQPMETAVCFETIEHIEDPIPLLRAIRDSAKTLYASVPNEDVMPYGNGYAFHHRHYTRLEFERLLNSAGWKVVEWWGQTGPHSEVERGVMGRTIIAVCEHDEIQKVGDMAIGKIVPQIVRTAPKHVAIVGLGPSSAQYVAICKSLGGRRKYCDETWGINAFGDVIACDRVFHMDDVRIQEIRAKAAPDSNIAGMLEWMRQYAGTIVTCRLHDDYPGLVEFPLEEVINSCPNGYFNSTAAYAVAYAIWLGVEKISLFGCDFTYPNAHDAEKGRACVEFWLGVASERGVKVVVPKTTSLLDACNSQDERFYGFSDTRSMEIARDGERIVVKFKERDKLPTAEEIEERYDHSAHPNPLVSQ